MKTPRHKEDEVPAFKAIKAWKTEQGSEKRQFVPEPTLLTTILSTSKEEVWTFIYNVACVQAPFFIRGFKSPCNFDHSPLDELQFLLIVCGLQNYPLKNTASPNFLCSIMYSY